MEDSRCMLYFNLREVRQLNDLGQELQNDQLVLAFISQNLLSLTWKVAVIIV